MFIIHETSFENLNMILDSGLILRSSEHQKLKLMNHRQGSKNRKLTTNVCLIDPKLRTADEVDAVYCRILDNKLSLYLIDDCFIILDANILQTNEFIFNTEENLGFRIDKDWVYSYTSFSGELGLTVSNYNDLLTLLSNVRLNYDRTELVILNSIDIKLIRAIYIKKKYYIESLISKCKEKNIKIIKDE